MEEKEKIFKAQSEKVGFDLQHRKVIRYNIGQYNQAVKRGKNYFYSLDAAKEQASDIKNYVLDDIEKLLTQFEEKAVQNGCEIYWASTAEEVLECVDRAIEIEQVKRVVKMKSMVSEELKLNEFLEKRDVEVNETDLGEFIVQQAGERPYHILTPAMHKSKEDVAELFNQKFGMDENSKPEEITEFVRDYLREKFCASDLGITGANFLISETGSVGLTENEGNGMMTFSWPRVLLTIAGIEKILPEWGDLDLFWPLLSVHGTGQQITAYNTILSGPKRENEADGPERMIIILFDGGRTRLYEEEQIDQTLKCIRCGACLNACPVYQTIGGFTYETTYTGPIGSVISSYMDGTEDTGFLNFASSLCGKCTEVCPVKIPLHHLLLLNRKKIVEGRKNKGVEKFFMNNYKKFMLSRKKLERVNAGWKNRAMKGVGMKVWGPRRSPLVFAKTSFSKSWVKKHP